MIQYRVMDEALLLDRCLHDGPIPTKQVTSTSGKPPDAESEAGVPQGTIRRFLRATCEAYGSCGAVAIDADNVIGLVWFYPKEVLKALNEGICIQMAEQVRALHEFDIADLPAKDRLSEGCIWIKCFQLVNDYKAVAEGRPPSQPSYLGRGIGTALLKQVTDWAKREGWERIEAGAVAHIPPLMMWSSNLSVERYRRLGFKVTPSTTGRVDTALHQRKGYHGKAMQEMWKPYAHLSDDEVSQAYEVSLDL